MTTAPAPVRPAARTHQTLTSGHLPRWAPWGLLAASLVVFGAIFAVIATAKALETMPVMNRSNARRLPSTMREIA